MKAFRKIQKIVNDEFHHQGLSNMGWEDTTCLVTKILKEYVKCYMGDRDKIS